MELQQAIRQRRATRSFTKQPPPKQLLEELIDAAIQAPSAVNAQPWHFSVIRNAALLDRISAQAKAHLLKNLPPGAAPNEIREHLEKPDIHIFYHAPALILISSTRADWAAENVALAAENLMLAACARGLGTCWIGFAQRWIMTDEGKRAVELPAGTVPVAPIIVGYPSEKMPPVPRRAPVIRWMD